jgi:hypothetical protein
MFPVIWTNIERARKEMEEFLLNIPQWMLVTTNNG